MLDQKQVLIDEAREISEEVGLWLNKVLHKLNDPNYDLGILTVNSPNMESEQREITMVDIVEYVQNRLEVIGVPEDKEDEDK